MRTRTAGPGKVNRGDSRYVPRMCNKRVKHSCDKVATSGWILHWLHQGSTLSPFLFIMVLGVLTENVRKVVPESMMFVNDVAMGGVMNLI